MRKVAVLLVALSLGACASAPPQMQSGAVNVTIGSGGRTATFHYLGSGGWMIRRGNDAVLLAPFFTNPGFVRLLFGADSNRTVVRQHMQRVQNDLPYVRAVLAGHAHYDHIMDLPTAMENVPASAPLLGSTTICNTLDSELRGRDCVDMTAYAGTHRSAPAPPSLTGVRVLPYFSEHAPHLLHTKLFSGHYQQPLPRVPSHPFRWREGETLAFVIDFLDASNNPELRIWYVDASPGKPYGMPDAATVAAPIDIAIFCVGSYVQQERYPEDYLDRLQPRHSLIGHWESFFRSANSAPRPIPFTSVPGFLARMGAYGYTLPDRHTVVTVTY